MKPRVRVLEGGSWVGKRVDITDETGTRTVACGWPRSTKSELDWRDTLRVGDVLRKGRSFRVVRQALYHNNGYLISVSLSIQRCSKYKRCFTGYLRNDLKQAGYSKTGVRLRLDKEVDAELLRNIRNHAHRTLYCWDTVGVIS